jgi:hypothetical protein
MPKATKVIPEERLGVQQSIVTCQMTTLRTVIFSWSKLVIQSLRHPSTCLLQQLITMKQELKFIPLDTKPGSKVLNKCDYLLMPCLATHLQS